MEVNYNKQKQRFEVWFGKIGEKLIRLEYHPTHPDTITDCEEFCLLGKAGIDCKKLRHPAYEKGKTLTDFCATLGYDYDYLLENKEMASEFIPNYIDVMEFYTPEEIENAKEKENV